MKHIFLWIFFILICYSCKKDIDLPPNVPKDSTQLINYNKDITVANWNIEWFGDGTHFNKDLNLQETNAGKVLKYLNADIYGLCEIVDTLRFGHMIRNNLSNEYKYIISYFTGGTQKLAFVYNRNIFRNVSARPFMGLSAQAYNSFGLRYPYLLNADVTVNGTVQNISFILIHAKANADIESYNRRLAGSIEMKDSLDSYYASKNFMVIGDYNDNFDKSIVAGKASPYQNFLQDNIRYNAITWPLNITGNQSSLGFANSVIDQQIVSSAMTKWYVSSSAKIRTDVTNAVPDYKTGNTSDHYPITSVYNISK